MREFIVVKYHDLSSAIVSVQNDRISFVVNNKLYDEVYFSEQEIDRVDTFLGSIALCLWNYDFMNENFLYHVSSDYYPIFSKVLSYDEEKENIYEVAERMFCE